MAENESKSKGNWKKEGWGKKPDTDTMIVTRIPPQNIDAEKSVLGAMLLDKDAIMTAVGADQYGREIRYRILNKLQGVYTPDGKPAVYRGFHDEPADEADDIYAAMYRLSKNY